ncbi:MAG: methylated-DNA--[protein]-cysteine S-methyltransferase [Nitrospinae bacterium]|nr:methylated-DNA--[protein]-cysteine S-methyltransferase [Nitrospinota bacterium]
MKDSVSHKPIARQYWVQRHAGRLRQGRSLPPDSIYYTLYSSPLGLTGIAGSKKGLMRIVLHLPDESHFTHYLKNSFQCECLKKPAFFEIVVKQLNLYFSGDLKNFNCKLDLSRGTSFQQKVWQQLTAIPYGKTQSYRMLAKAIGQPKAFRAVGNANGKNPLPLIIPCHRVIRENGDMGGYTGGLHLKRFLLDLERNN